MAWIKSADGARYYNLEKAGAIKVRELSDGDGIWCLFVEGVPSNASYAEFRLSAGPYNSQADGLEAVRKIVHGVDLSTEV